MIGIEISDRGNRAQKVCVLKSVCALASSIISL